MIKDLYSSLNIITVYPFVSFSFMLSYKLHFYTLTSAKKVITHAQALKLGYNFIFMFIIKWDLQYILDT